MKRSDFYYDLPPGRIAQEPVRPRDASRLLVLDRATGTLTDARFRHLTEFLEAGSLLVVNDTRVIPARLWGTKSTGGRAEVLLLTREGEGRWEALIRSAKRSRPGTRIAIDGGGGAEAEVLESRGEGLYAVLLHADDPERLIDQAGEVPLPPYIRREAARPEDRRWYQTRFAHPEKGGSAAAPTAGLHFTPRVLASLEARGIERASVTLHVGLGTFLPVRTDDVGAHRMHLERFEMPEATARAVNRALDEGRPVVAVGTTAVRVLEHCGRSGRVEPGDGWTDLFVLPGHDFRVVGAMVTNFHLPESTLLMLVCAFGGRGPVMAAYRHAVEKGYRFYSYGDAMLIR